MALVLTGDVRRHCEHFTMQLLEQVHAVACLCTVRPIEDMRTAFKLLVACRISPLGRRASWAWLLPSKAQRMISSSLRPLAPLSEDVSDHA